MPRKVEINSPYTRKCTITIFCYTRTTAAKSTNYSGLICSGKGNSKFFSLLSNIKKPLESFPFYLYSTHFWISLLSFFATKISNVIQQLAFKGVRTSVLDSLQPSLSITHLFSSFTRPSTTVISKLIQKSIPSTCQLNPLPTVLVKAFLPSLASHCDNSLFPQHSSFSVSLQNPSCHSYYHKTWCKSIQH